MKIVGVREISGVSRKTGKPWSGINLYYTEPIPRGGVGFYACSTYFGGDSADVVRSIGGENFSALIGAEVSITYNRFGRPVGLTLD